MKFQGIHLFLLVTLVALYSSNFLTEGTNVPIISNEGYVIAEIEASENNSTITIVSECKEISVNVDPHQSLSIYHGVEGTNFFRPLTQDLVRDISNEFGITLLMAKIDTVTDGNPAAGKLYFNKGNKLLELDSRMTDIVGIAYRMEIPVYIRSDIMDSFGKDRC